MKPYKCQYPVDLAYNPRTVDNCDAPAKYETDDLQEVHYLCEKHHREASKWDTFRSDELP